MQLPTGGQPGIATTHERQLFLQENFLLTAGAPVAVGSTFEQQWFLELNLWLPTSAASATVTPADRFNYR